MTATGGWTTVIKAAGTATALASENCSDLGGDVWQVTDSAKRVLDPDTAIVVHDLDGEVDAGEYTVDYLFGKLTFSVAPNGANPGDVHIDSGKYFPLWEITTAHASEITISRDVLDCTQYNNTHIAKQKLAGLQEVSVPLEVYDDGQDDYDTGVGEELILIDRLIENDAVAFLLEVRLDSASTFRGWGKLTEQKTSAPSGGLLNTAYVWTASEYKGSQGAVVSFGLSDE